MYVVARPRQIGDPAKELAVEQQPDIGYTTITTIEIGCRGDSGARDRRDRASAATFTRPPRRPPKSRPVWWRYTSSSDGRETVTARTPDPRRRAGEDHGYRLAPVVDPKVEPAPVRCHLVDAVEATCEPAARSVSAPSSSTVMASPRSPA